MRRFEFLRIYDVMRWCGEKSIQKQLPLTESWNMGILFFFTTNGQALLSKNCVRIRPVLKISTISSPTYVHTHPHMYTQVMFLKALVLDATQASAMYLGRTSHRTNCEHAGGLKVRVSQMRYFLPQMPDTQIMLMLYRKNARPH